MAGWLSWSAPASSSSDHSVTTSTPWLVWVPVGSSSSTTRRRFERAISSRMVGRRSSVQAGGRSVSFTARLPLHDCPSLASGSVYVTAALPPHPNVRAAPIPGPSPCAGEGSRCPPSPFPRTRGGAGGGGCPVAAPFDALEPTDRAPEWGPAA